MAFVMVRHTVADFAAWKAVFDRVPLDRKAAGWTSGLILRDSENPNDLTVLVETEDLAQLRAFLQTDELREAMQQAGVTSAPEMRFLETAERITIA